MYFVYALIAAFIVSCISFAGLFIFFADKKFVDRILLYLLSLSAGGVLGGGLFHLLPEALSRNEDVLTAMVFCVVGFSIFFVIEKVLHWHQYHHTDNPHNLRIGYINLIGDSFHNFLDGIVIITAFSITTQLGFAVTIAVILHEIPHEIGNYGVLLYAGFSRTKALFFNFIAACVAMVGVVMGYLLIQVDVQGVDAMLVPVAAGSFLYIAGTDLIPEIHKEERLPQSILAYIVFICSLVIMYLLKIYGAE